MTGKRPPRTTFPQHILKDKPALILTLIAITVIVLIIVTLPLFYKTGEKTKTYGRLLMGTVVEITLREENPEAAGAAFSEIERLEAIFSSYIPESDVSRISGSAGTSPVGVSPEVIHVLKVALNISKMSRGAFDPTVGILGNVWNFSDNKGYVPSSAEVENLLPLVDYKKILIDEKASKAGLATKGMRLNLGGVAKGYIVGKAVEVLKGAGIEWGIIKAGGDMVAFQKGNSGEHLSPFTIGIQHPRERGKLLGKVRIAGGVTATSGDYERFFMKDGVRYHHILDPRTGYPARRCRSVTVIAEDPADPAGTDGLSTAVFVMGAEEGMDMVEGIDGVEAVIVDSKGRVYVSSGLKENFIPG
jgi:thiamine biosynthesis lipoprotein